MASNLLQYLRLPSPFKQTENDQNNEKETLTMNTEHRVDYSLNKTKSAHKLIRSTEREFELVTEYKTGNIVFTLQLGLYEILKLAIHKLYTNHPSEGREITYRPTIEKSNDLEVGCVYTVFDYGEKAYVVNLYHTTCKLVVNGKRELDFINDDVPLLYEITQSLKSFYGNDIINVLNGLFRNNIFLMNKDTEDKQDSSGKSRCIVCQKNVLSRAVQCHTCNNNNNNNMRLSACPNPHIFG